jgi:hypothetical protein
VRVEDMQLVYPVGYLDIDLPPENAAVGFAVGYGGVAALTPARLMRANVELLNWRAPLHFGCGRDSQGDRAEWLAEVGRFVTYFPPDRPLSEKGRKSRIDRIKQLIVRRQRKEINRPPSFEMIGGSLPARTTPYGHRPDKMAKDFELWRKTVEADAYRISENMRRRRAARGSLGVFGRSDGSHEIANAYGQWILKSELEPNYVVSILPIFPEEREDLLAYLTLLKKFGISRNELLVPYSPNWKLGSLMKSDVAFLTTFLLGAMTSQRPDIITLVEKARRRNPFAGFILKKDLIPIRYVQDELRVFQAIPVLGGITAKPDENYEVTIETLLSDIYLEMATMNVKPLAIFLHGPFMKEEAKKIEETYHYEGCPVIVGYGATCREGHFAEIYGVGFYVLEGSRAFPPSLAKVAGVYSLDEVKEDSDSSIEEGYEILSKFCAVDIEVLFRRGDKD